MTNVQQRIVQTCTVIEIVGANILLISELNCLAINNKKDCVRYIHMESAIKILDRKIKNQGTGPGYTYVTSSYFTMF